MRNQDDLAAYFRGLTDEELIRQYSPNRLTTAAQSIAEAEIRSRDLHLPELEAPAETDEPVAAYHGDFRTVARRLDPTEAHILKAHLQSCSIPAMVADANLVQANPFLGAAVGGASVRVPEAFVPEALELIAGFDKGEFQAPDEPGGKQGADAEAEPPGKPQRLTTYRIYSRPGQATPIVVKVGFSWAAFIFGPLWFLVNKMWLNFLIVATLFVGGNLYFHHHRPATNTESLLFASAYALYLLIWFAIGKLANSLLAADLEEKGYRLVATVAAKNSAYARDQAAGMPANQSAAG